jgi:hypothetical protein
MKSPLDSLLDKVKETVAEHAGEAGLDKSGLVGKITELFGDHKQQGGGHDVKPASEDPYGDPADQAAGAQENIKPASEDPYGDPADQEKR